MSRVPGNYSFTWVRGATVEESIAYRNADGTPVDLTGFSARLQIRHPSGRYGNDTTSLVLDLSSEDMDPGLFWDTADQGQLRIRLRPDQHQLLNPDNEAAAVYVYGVEFYRPDGMGEYVIPVVSGTLKVLSEIVR